MARQSEEIQEGTGLAQVLRLRHVVAIGLGFTVSDGILLVLSQMFGQVGPSTLLLTAVAALAMSLIMFAGAELAGGIPSADFVGEWGKQTLGSFWGFMGTLSYGAVAIIAVGLLWFPMGTYLHQFFSSVPVPIIGTVCFVVTAVIVYLGARISGEAEAWLNIGLFGVVLVMSVIMVFHFHPAHFTPFFTAGGSAWFKAFPFMIYIIFGPEVMFAASEESVAGRRFWPKAMGICMLVIVGSFLFMELALIGLLPVTSYSLNEADFATAAKHLFGSFGEGLFNVIGFMAVFHAMIGALYVGSRFIYKMGHRGYLPKTFTVLNRKTKAPNRALLLTLAIGAAIGSTYYLKQNFYLQAAALLTAAGLFGWLVICLSHISYRLRPSVRAKFPADWHVPPGDGPAGIWISVLGLVVVAVTGASFLIQDAFHWWYLPLWVVVVFVWWAIGQRIAAAKSGRTELEAPLEAGEPA